MPRERGRILKRVFVSGPLTPRGPGNHAVEYLSNCREMILVANRLLKKGYAVFCPGLDMGMFLLDGNPESIHELIYENDLAWLEVADLMVLVGDWEDSPGCQREHRRACELGMGIYTEEELPDES